MSREEQRSAVVRYWWTRAEDSLASAERELEAEAYSFAVNRLYYAVFYAASALLLERGHSFKKHTGVRATFHREFVRTGELGAEWGKLYDQLFEDRQEADYIALISFEPGYVEHQLARTVEFLHQLRPLIASLRAPDPPPTDA